jgi:hypothetical protein
MFETVIAGIATNVMKKRNQQAVTPKPLLQMVVEIPATVFDVAYRKSFGEQYFPPVRAALAVVFIWAWMFISREASWFGQYQDLNVGIGDGESSSWMQVVLLVVGGLSIFHQIQIAARNNKGKLWAPQCTGISWLDRGTDAEGNDHFIGDRFLGQYRLTDETVYILVEPITAFLIAWLASTIETELGVFFAVCAACLTIRNLLVYTQLRNKQLDVIQQALEKQYLRISAIGRDKRQSAGVNRVVVPPALLKAAAALLEAQEAEERRVVYDDFHAEKKASNGAETVVMWPPE